MAKSVQLPFVVPNFATVQSSGAAELAMIGHPTAFNQTLNQVTNICCTSKFIRGYTSPEVSIPNVYVYSYKFMERYFVNLRYAYNSCMDIIKSMLNDGMYVFYHSVDDFYLPGKSWYGIRHIHHDGVICGYDDNDETISIAAYDINWVYNLIRVPQKCFLEAVTASLEKKQYGDLIAYKIRANTVAEIKEGEMLNFLKEYMDSSFEKYPIDKDNEVRGIVVHNYLAMYMDKLKDGSIPYDQMDWRALRPIWEHKKCMFERIKAVESKNGMDCDLSQRYVTVVAKADKIRIMYAMYHKNHNDKLLDKIRDGLLGLAQSDKELVGELINRLEKCVK